MATVLFKNGFGKSAIVVLAIACGALTVLYPRWQDVARAAGYYPSIPKIDSISIHPCTSRFMATIQGTNFDDLRNSLFRFVWFGNIASEAPTKWSNTEIQVRVPFGLQAGVIYPVSVNAGFNGRSEPVDYLAENLKEDADGDGLWDAWETVGIDNDCNGTIDLDLPNLGANYQHKDLFLEIDWMEAPTHNHRPKDKAINDLIAAFDSAPVSGNPDGLMGIKLHVDVSNSVPHQDRTSFDFPLIGLPKSDFDDIKAANFSPERKYAYRYALVAHQISQGIVPTSASGVAEIGGNDLIVALGTWNVGSGDVDGDGLPDANVGTVNQQLGTLMHEFGHTLGLLHGGDDGKNCKPNYLSVMNYLWQHRGISDGQAITVRFDYSHEQLPLLGYLDEDNLDETVGIQDGNDVFLYRCPSNPTGNTSINQCIGYTGFATGNGAVDWNCKDGIDNDLVDADVNGDGRENNLHGHNDWDNLVYRFQDSLSFSDGIHENVTPAEQELDYDTVVKGALDHPLVSVAVDIKPDSENNVINMKSKGVVPVAILSSSDFDATTVIVESVVFAGSYDIKHEGHIEDVNGDGFLDLVLHFNTQSLVLGPNSTIGTMMGKTTDRKLILGEDSLVIKHDAKKENGKKK